MSVESNPPTSMQLIEETRKQINRLFDEVARLSEAEIPPSEYYGELLKRVVQGLAAPAGAVWVRTDQGHLQLQHQINLKQVGLESESDRQVHNELLRQACQQARPMHLPPQSSSGASEAGTVAAGNPTEFEVLLVPILVDQLVAGLIEVWQSPNRNPAAVPGFLQFMSRMAHLASVYARNHKLRHITGQQQLWTQLETFARQIHASLNPTEVAYLISNEGRRLVECDRLSVGIRQGKRTQIVAISGADVVEKRSNLVQLMRELVERVLAWNEQLLYAGVKDDTLPPNVLTALDAFLAESNSKLLVIQPLRDERESESTKPARSALVMECFEPDVSAEQLTARLEVVGRHATSALYNAIEHRRIPGRWIWQPLARLQEGLGGKARAIGLAVTAAVVVLVAAMFLVPYPLKMEAKGQLLPRERRWIYSPVEGRVVRFPEEIRTGAHVSDKQQLVLMEDVQLQLQMVRLKSEIEAAEESIRALQLQENAATSPIERMKLSGDRQGFEVQRKRKDQELNALKDRTNSESQPGFFWLRAPIEGTILNWDFREKLTNKQVKPSEPLLRVGDQDKGWEIELKIPQKHIGQVLQAMGKNSNAELDVDLLLLSAPTRTFKGKVARNKIAGEAVPNTEDANESDPVVLASVRIDGPGIAASDRLPRDLLVTGTEVHSRIRCGLHPMGYSLFYGLWEFFYEKVVFLF